MGRLGRLVATGSVAALVLAAAACSRSVDQPIPRVLAAVAERDVVDGEARPSTTVTLRFDREFRLASERLPLASYFEFQVPGLDAKTSNRVLVQDATVETENRRQVVLNVREVIPDGAILSIARRAFRPDAEGAIEVEVDGDLPPIQALFATTLFTFGSGDIVPEPPTIPPVAPGDRDEATQRAALEAHLDSRAVSPEVRSQALARFGSLPPEMIPSPKLRAALAALTGTFADAAAGSLVTANNCTDAPAALVAFQEPPERPDLLARVTRDALGRRVFSFNPTLEGEQLEHLMVLLAHEAIHCDVQDGRFEEIAATAFDTLLYIQLLVWFPDLSRTGTTLARDFNIDALAMLNSGRRFPESGGVLASSGLGPVLPGSSAQHRSFAEVVAAAYPEVLFNDSPTEDLAADYAATLSAALGFAVADPFNLLYLDELISRAFTPEMIAALLDSLELAPA